MLPLETGMRIRKPGTTDWIALDTPDMPTRIRIHTPLNKVNRYRERPVYTEHANGDITVHQTWIPGHNPATRAEMMACDDHTQLNAYGLVVFSGPYRSPKPSPRNKPGIVLHALEEDDKYAQFQDEGATAKPFGAQLEEAFSLAHDATFAMLAAIGFWQVLVWVAPDETGLLGIELGQFLQALWILT